MVSVAVHPEIKNRVVVADLSRDIDMLLDCDAEELKRRIFGTDLAEDEERAPVKEVVLNRCPFVAPIEVVRPADAERLGFDFDAIERRRQALASVPDLATKIGSAYRREPLASEAEDAEFALFDRFIDDVDKPALATLQTALATGAPWPAFRSEDARLETLALRLKARLRPAELDVHEAAAWRDHVRGCLEDGLFGRRLSLKDFREEVARLARRRCRDEGDRAPTGGLRAERMNAVEFHGVGKRFDEWVFRSVDLGAAERTYDGARRTERLRQDDASATGQRRAAAR